MNVQHTSTLSEMRPLDSMLTTIEVRREGTPLSASDIVSLTLKELKKCTFFHGETSEKINLRLYKNWVTVKFSGAASLIPLIKHDGTTPYAHILLDALSS